MRQPPANDSRNLTDEQKLANPLPRYCATCGNESLSGTPCKKAHLEHYTDGTNQFILVHRRENCKGEWCVIHRPSNHVMVHMPTHWRWDRYMMERICDHGIGHPDPDDIAFTKQNAVHGCDGCCTGTHWPSSVAPPTE